MIGRKHNVEMEELAPEIKNAFRNFIVKNLSVTIDVVHKRPEKSDLIHRQVCVKLNILDGDEWMEISKDYVTIGFIPLADIREAKS